MLDGFIINKGFIRSMEEQERKSHRRRRVRNWLLIFNWNSGTFERWVNVETNPESAAQQYASFESSKPFDEGYEVVLIGAKSVRTIETTHAHYFGINSYDEILAGIGINVTDIRQKIKGRISPTTRKVLEKLWRKAYWGAGKRVSYDTLKNHYCHGIGDFSASVEELIRLGYLHSNERRGPFSLNMEKKSEIDEIFEKVT